MEITCPRCTARHDIDLPAGARARTARPLRFRCSHCGHSFTVDPSVAAAVTTARSSVETVLPVAPPVEAPRPDAPRGEAPSTPALPMGARGPSGSANQPDTIARVRVQGQEFDVADLATLQRWILEERVRPDDLCARTDGVWKPLHTRADLAIFFSAAARLSESPVAIERVIAPPVDADGGPATVKLAGDPHALDERPALHEEDRATTVILPSMPDLAPITRDDTLEQAVTSPSAPHAAALPVGATGPDASQPEMGDAPTIVSTPDLARDGRPSTPSPFGGPASRPLGDFGPSPAVSPPSGRDDEADPGFNFPAPSDADEDLFRDAAPAPSRTARRLVTGVVVVLVVIGVFAGTRMLGGGSHARPEPEAEPATASQAAPPAPAAPATGEAPPAIGASGATPAPPVAASAPVTPSSAPPVAPAAAEPPKPVAEPSKLAATRASTPPPRAAAAASSSTKSTRATSSAPPQRLLSEGWKAVEKGDYDAARDLFSLALQGKASAGALYGRGYANEKLGRTAEAGADYCRALTLDADVELSREIQSGLRRIGQTC